MAKASVCKFPAPREVDRYLYERRLNMAMFYEVFPAPLEVDRELYGIELES